MRRRSNCHPDAPHMAKGLCFRCYNQAYYLANKAARTAQNRAWRVANIDKHRRSARALQRAKLPKPTRAEPNKCECCGGKTRRALSLDHCHARKRFRGWLCGRCNTAIGMLGDNLRGVLRAVSYLRRATP